MRVADGYHPKVKFSVSLTAETYRRLNDYCYKAGKHRSQVIEEAVRRSLEGRNNGSLTVLTEAPKTVRDIAAKRAPKPKKKAAPKPVRRRSPKAEQ